MLARREDILGVETSLTSELLADRNDVSRKLYSVRSGVRSRLVKLLGSPNISLLNLSPSVLDPVHFYVGVS